MSHSFAADGSPKQIIFNETNFTWPAAFWACGNCVLREDERVITETALGRHRRKKQYSHMNFSVESK